MINRRFPIALFVAGVLMSSSLYAMARSTTFSDVAADKKDNPPRPKPKPGPRDGGDDN